MVDTDVLLSASSIERRAAMQLPPDEQEFIRRAFHVEGQAIRQIERETGHSRQAIRRAISNKPPSLKSAPSSPFRSAPIFARQRALPQGPDLPPPQRRLSAVCTPGYLGRKRGEVVRTRTTLLQAHTHQWLFTFGGAGNGDYRGELVRGLTVIVAYQTALNLLPSQALVRLDGLYGNGAIIVDLIAAGVCFVMRGKDYALLDLTQVKERLALPADEQFTHPESGTCRDVFDCGEVPVTAQGHRSRLIVATHQATTSPIGVTRDGVVYELFFTALPARGFTAADVVKLYLHRGSFETVLADEDREQDK
jgi:hypothetical protein